MKIICIGRNYALHAAELGNDVPSEPLFFLKPDSALITNNRAFFLPDFSQDIHHELELVVRIDRLGKHIDEKYAHLYYSKVALGIDFTARDLQSECKAKGQPWEKAKAFDGSAPLSKFKALKDLGDYNDLDYSLSINGEEKQRGNPAQMIFHIDYLISYLSKFLTLKIGDLIYTGTPAGVSRVQREDHIVCTLNGERMIDMKVK